MHLLVALQMDTFCQRFGRIIGTLNAKSTAGEDCVSTLLRMPRIFRCRPMWASHYRFLSHGSFIRECRSGICCRDEGQNPEATKATLQPL